MNIIKIRDSPFSLFTWYQQKGKPNFFGDHVSFRSLYSPSETLHRYRCCWISSPPSLPSDLLAAGDFFRPALLWSETSDSKVHETYLHVGGNPIGKQLSTRRHVPLFFGGLRSTRQRVWARGPLSGAEIPSPGSSDVILLIHPSGSPPRALLIHLFNHFGSAAPPSVALLHGLGHFSSSQVP